MSSRTWTPQQQRAIEQRGSLLVAAAAGAGKTAVLTERVVAQVRAGTDIRALLVVTFTKAAAGEMKKRIAAALREAALGETGAAAERLRAAAERTGDASISTLHAFCAQVLRRHFYEAGLDPAFRPADEAEAAILLEDALDMLLEARCGQEDFDVLCDLFGGAETIGKLLLEIRAFMQAQVEPMAYLRAAVEAYHVTEAELRASPLVALRLQSVREALEAAMEDCRRGRDGIAAAYPEAAALVDDELMRLRGAMQQADYEALAAALAGIPFGTLRFPKGTPEAEKAPLQRARNALKEAVRAQAKALSTPLAEEAARMRALYPAMQTLYESAQALEELYAQAKQDRGVVDYNDMEHMTLALFRRPEIAGEYRARFTHIFMDEYQDANRVQEAILAAIRREGGLFLVGDVKQSIYRFRQAEPALFMEKYDDPASFGAAVIDLNANFRSSSAVVEAVNGIFSRVMSRRVGGTAYDERAALAGMRETRGAAELHVLDGVDAAGAMEAETLRAAQCIRDIMENERYTQPDGSTRPYRYADFAILHRSPRPVAERMTQLLAVCGIPAYAELTGGYFEAVEVQVFMNLLRVIDNRRQDIPLLSVMRSMIGGFTDEELAAMKPAVPGADWLDALNMAAHTETALAYGQKAREFLARLDSWYEEAGLVSVCELCGMLLDETGYADFCAALPGGRLRRGNLDALCALSAAFEQEEARSLSGFIAWMDRVKNTDRMGAAANPGADVVRLLSTHRSKGLEFPVVILTGLSKQFNQADQRQAVALSATLGLGVRYRQDSRRYDTLARMAIAAQAAEASLSEEMRILYVAMTRARDRLMLLVSEKDAAETIARHDVPPTPALCASARREADWLYWALLSLPEGAPLRGYAGLADTFPPAADPCIRVHIHHQQKCAAVRRPGAATAALIARGDPAVWAGRLDWAYPHQSATRIPGKLSVSDLTGNLRRLRAYPAFIAEKRPLDAADRGTAAHLLMETISLQAHTRQSVRAEIDALVAAGRMRPAQAETLYIPAVVDFFASPLGRRLCASPRAERELMFNYRASAKEILGIESEEQMLLQGIIDCCFMEGDAWVLLDYKTDFVPEGGAEAVAGSHARQLALYAAALTALTGIPVKERYIHLLRTGESVAL